MNYSGLKVAVKETLSKDFRGAEFLPEVEQIVFKKKLQIHFGTIKESIRQID